MFPLVVICALLYIAAGDLAQPFFDDKIVGGEETTIEQYPYQVSILYIFRHICGGSIVNERTVLTAAHCTYGQKPFKFQVRAGTTYKNDKNEPGKLYNVDKIMQHPNFSIQTIDNDISVLKLKQSIEFTNQIQPIPLQSANLEVPAKVLISVTGWGAIKEGAKGVNILRKVMVETISTEQCNKSYPAKITNNMFCAQFLGKDACQGDSGGPATYDGHLVGIVSWGLGCARPKYPGVFTKISSLRAWIHDNINA